MEVNLDSDTQFEYLKKKKIQESYPEYGYYKVIKTVSDEIMPEPE